VTSLSVAVAFVIGAVELGGLIAQHLSLSGGFWTWLEHINLNVLGLMIAALFVATWVIAAAVWRLGRIEERWNACLTRE
jgi:nickel/cobalt transporter (NiCoT) family protein